MLHALLVQGDHDAVVELIRRHRPSVLATARSIVGPHQAEDVCQDTFERLLRRPGSLRDGQAVSAWLITTARRRSIDLLRAASARHELATDDVPDAPSAARTETVVESTILTEHILGSVRPADAQVLIDHYVSDRSIATMAASRGTTTGSIKVRLSRSRRRAREVARQKGIGLLGGGVPAWLRTVGDRLPQLSEGLGAGAAALIIGLAVTLGGVQGVDVEPPARAAAGSAVAPVPPPTTGAAAASGAPAAPTPSSAVAADGARSGTAPIAPAADPPPPPEEGGGSLPGPPVEPPESVQIGERDKAPAHRIEITDDDQFGVETSEGDPAPYVSAFGDACDAAGTPAPAVVECEHDEPNQRIGDD